MDPSPVKYLACLDDLALNDRFVYKGSRKPTRKPTHRRARHGRPPDSRQPESRTSDQHDTSVTSSHVFVPSDSETMHVSPARVKILSTPSTAQFLFLDSSKSTSHNEKPHPVPDLPRNAGIRAVLQSPTPPVTARRQMTAIVLSAAKTRSLGAFKSIIGSIPRPDQNNQPFGSTYRSGYYGIHVPGA